jgi:hypothetical protein
MSPYKLRSHVARASSCSPFEVSVLDAYVTPESQLHLVQTPVAMTSDLDLPQSLSKAYSPPSNVIHGELETFFRICGRSLSYVSQNISLPRIQRFVVGRPVLFSAKIGQGRCNLDHFSLPDFLIYRFDHDRDRSQAHITHRWAQEFLRAECERAGWTVEQQPGCVVSMGAGAAVGE